MPPEPTDRRSFLRTLVGAAVAGPALVRAEAAQAAVPRTARASQEAYLLDPGLTYLNHASIGTVPRTVHEAHQAYLELCESHPSLYVWGEPWRVATEETRTAAAALLGAEGDDLAITHNTTEGFNVLAHGLPLEAGDEVLFSSLNHGGASMPWRGQARRRGFTVRRFDFPVEQAPELTSDEVVELHRRALSPETRVLVVPHVDNQVGLRHPLPELAAMARSEGVRWVLVDGAQSAGMLPVDLAASGVDAYAMSPHKWIQSPKGLGLFWTRPELRRLVPAFWYRTAMSRHDSARRYEDYSTRAWPAVVALGDAVAFQRALGPDETARRHRAIRRRIQDRVASEPRLSWRSPGSWALGSAIVSVRVEGHPAAELGHELLQDHNIVVRAFGGPLDHLRLSPHVATPDAQIDAALDLLAAS